MQYSEDMKNREFKRSIKSNSVQVGLQLCFKNVYRGCLSKVQWEFVPRRRPVEAEGCFTVLFSFLRHSEQAGGGRPEGAVWDIFRQAVK